ncbi:MAG: RNA 2',3'-cyclic phosphodiesterase [Candidatus Micrarchaeia archaeon]
MSNETYKQNRQNIESMRVFIALDLSEEAKETVYNSILKIINSEKSVLKIVKKDQLHITLFFFPNINEEKLENLYNIIDNIKINPFKIKIKGINTFNLKSPKILFLNLIDQSNSILYLYNLLKNNAIENGAIVEHKDFNPHITIARVKRDAKFIDYKKISEIISKSAEIDFGEFVCDEIKVFKSRLTQKGPIYNALHKKVL